MLFQLLHQIIGLPEEVRKLLTNYKNYWSLDLKLIHVKELHVKEIKKRGNQIK